MTTTSTQRPSSDDEGNELCEQAIRDTSWAMELVPAYVRTFQEIVRQASFSRAAEALHLGQPAVRRRDKTFSRALEAVLAALERAAAG
jgi:hypothetical protein